MGLAEWGGLYVLSCEPADEGMAVGYAVGVESGAAVGAGSGFAVGAGRGRTVGAGRGIDVGAVIGVGVGAGSHKFTKQTFVEQSELFAQLSPT